MASNFTEAEVIYFGYEDFKKVLFRAKVPKVSSSEQEVTNNGRNIKAKGHAENQYLNVIDAGHEKPNTDHQVREHIKILLHKTEPNLIPDQ
jgi:hypothetical protein